MKPTEPTEPTDATAATQPAKPAQPAKATQPAKPAEQTLPTQPAKPAERTQTAKPAEKVAPTQPTGRSRKPRQPKPVPQPVQTGAATSADAVSADAVSGEQPPAKVTAKKATPAKRTPRKAVATPVTETPAATEAPAAETKPAETKPAETPAAETRAAATPAAAKTSPEAVEEKTAVAVSPTETAAVATTVPQQPQERTDPWSKLIANPAHAPELLALAAVQTIGPRARTWAAQMRAAYPAADDTALARLATRQFTRFGSITSLFGAIAGSYAPAALLAGAALTHAELVLHVAAAYGLDPTDPKRAAELLVVARVHATADEAEAALAGARRPAYDEEGGLADALVRLGRLVAAPSGSWTVARLVNRYFPGTSLLTAVLTSAASAQGAAARAITYYRSQVSSESGSSV